jgi:glycosyltransferase involved in cell wall biosynthesis
MKILLVNKFFYHRGGSERVMFDTARLLEEHGHTVRFFSMAHPENLRHADSVHFVPFVDLRAQAGPAERLRTAGRILYYRAAAKRIGRLLDEAQPDIVHLHNIHHQISPSIIPEIRKRSIPSVMTLHDYKMVCGTYRLERGGKICEECSGGRYYRCFRNRCQGGSRAGSALTAAEMYLHHRILRLWPMIDLFISPSRFLKEKLAEMGFPGRIEVLPNFVDPGAFASPPVAAGFSLHADLANTHPEGCGYGPSLTQPVAAGFSLRNDSPDRTAPTQAKVYPPDRGVACGYQQRPSDLFLYLGRLSPEKGLFTLLRAFERLPARLRILGDGPLRGELETEAARRAPGRVAFLGHRPREEIARELNASAAVIVPSEWYENNPISILESYAAGRPVIGARIGGIPELVRAGETGLTFAPGDAGELAEEISFFLSHPEEAEKMGRAGRDLVKMRFDPESYYRRLMEIYGALLKK